MLLEISKPFPLGRAYALLTTVYHFSVSVISCVCQVASGLFKWTIKSIKKSKFNNRDKIFVTA